MFGTKIEHLLGFPYTADEGTCKMPTLHDQRPGSKRDWIGNSDQYHCFVTLQELKIGVIVVLG